MEAAERDSSLTVEHFNSNAPKYGPSLRPSLRRAQYEQRRTLRREVRKSLSNIYEEATGHSKFRLDKRAILEKKARRAKAELDNLEPPVSDRQGNALARAQKADHMYNGARVADEGIPAKYFEGTQATSPKITEQNCAELVAEFESAAAEAQAENDRDVLAWMDEMIAQTTNQAAQETSQVTGHTPWFSDEYYVPDGARNLAPEYQLEAFVEEPGYGDEARA